MIVPLSRLFLNTNNADAAITTSTARNSSQSQLPMLAPLNDKLIITAETVTYGKKKAMKAMIAAPPAITYPRFCSCFILSIEFIEFIENLTFLITTRSHQLPTANVVGIASFNT